MSSTGSADCLVHFRGPAPASDVTPAAAGAEGRRASRDCVRALLYGAISETRPAVLFGDESRMRRRSANPLHNLNEGGR